MDLRLTSVNMPATGVTGIGNKAASSASKIGGADGGFSSVLKGALGAVSSAQSESAEMQKQVQLENPNVSLEQTMMSMQKAQIGFQGVNAVRNKMVAAYSEIMSMNV